MGTESEILIESLKDTLQQAERYFLWSIFTAVLLFLFSSDVPALKPFRDNLKLPVIGETTPEVTEKLLWCGYVYFGLMVNAALTQITKIASRIDNATLVSASLSRFSAITTGSWLLQWLVPLLPPSLVFSAYFGAMGGFANISRNYPTIIAVAIASVPYASLYNRLNDVARLARAPSP